MKMMQIPCLDFSGSEGKEEGSEGWKSLCKEVREACEGYGCFQLVYNEIPEELHQDVLKVTKELFDLPDETKQKNTSPRPFYGYIGGHEVVPLYESLGIEDAPSLHAVQAFTQLMWPHAQGNPAFSKAINSMSSKIHELELIVVKMIMESYGLEKYYKSFVESNNNVFRVMRYKAPESKESVMGLAPHVDKSALTILSQDSVQGLEILTKEEDHWVQVMPSPGAFVVFVGEAFRAWSNGRLHSVKHRVMMRGDKTRYSFALFSTPKEGTVIEAPKELIDKQHPQLFRTFNYMDFLNYYYAHHADDNALQVYAGLQQQ